MSYDPNFLSREGIIEGPVAPPGRYTVKLTVGAQSYTQPFTVVNDPRVRTPLADLAAQHALARRSRGQAVRPSLPSSQGLSSSDRTPMIIDHERWQTAHVSSGSTSRPAPRLLVL